MTPPSVTAVNARLQAALREAQRYSGEPLTLVRHTMAALAQLQGTGPLDPRCTLRSISGHVALGDFALGPQRHDGRWRLVIDERGVRFADIDVGRRLARRLAAHGLETALAFLDRASALTGVMGRTTLRSGLRDVVITTTHAGYRLTGCSRSSTIRLPASIAVTASGIIDWASFAVAGVPQAAVLVAWSSLSGKAA